MLLRLLSRAYYASGEWLFSAFIGLMIGSLAAYVLRYMV